jgi:mannose-1-phosphate guanylyltransferase
MTEATATEATAAVPSPLAGLDGVILAGGLGTRLRPVLGDTPKALARVAEVAFVDVLIHWLQDQGLRRLLFCLGHQAERIMAHLEQRSYGGIAIECIVEPEPLGTGGALRNARDRLTSDPVLVMNGDTMADVSLASFLAAHEASGCEVSMLCLAVDDLAAFGALSLDARGRVASFSEKQPAAEGSGLANGGAYLFSQTALSRLAEAAGPSLERDFLQTRPAGTILGYRPHDARFFDIGTPENLARAASALPASWQRALREAAG